MLGILRTAGSWLLGGLSKTTKVVGGTAAVGAAGEAAINGRESAVAAGATNIYEAFTTTGAEGEITGKFQGFYQLLENLADMIEIVFGKGSMDGLRNIAKIGKGESEIVTNSADGRGQSPSEMASASARDLNLTNFYNGLSGVTEMSASEWAHKGKIAVHSLGEGAVHIGTGVAQLADGADWLLGKVLSPIVDTGYADRNFSAYVQRNGMSAVNHWGAPELNTAWDRALHFTGEAAPAVAGISMTFGASAMSSLSWGTGLVSSNQVAHETQPVPRRQKVQPGGMN